MGQAAIELLLVSILLFALISALASSISAETQSIRKKTGDFRETGRAEAVIRAVEAAYGSGGDVDLGSWGEHAPWRAESGLIRIWHEGRVVEIRGVFNEDRSEPI
ncbi:hypothetical protein L0Y65_03960 [Candidatus Micrarchaeota archaeon]|nr:hypothetical protein [Candidatus Micrarchaeota archaeon]